VKKKLFYISFALVLLLALILAPATPAVANTLASSQMIFNGALTYEGGGVYTGTIDMTKGTYYALGGPGEEIYNGTDVEADQGGFDVYAKTGANAYYDSALQGVIGSDHDAYSEGGGWGSFYNPDCADWQNYHLTLTADSWALIHNSTTNAEDEGGVPMSGTMDWTAGYAAETDTGAYFGSGYGTPANLGWAATHGGGAGTWDMDWSWGSEVIPLQFPGFDVSITGTTGDYTVTLTPAAAGTTNLTIEVPDIVAISVDPTTIDYGTLIPGQTSDPHDIDVTNVGTHEVNVSAAVSGTTDDLFYDNLELKNYTTNIPNWGEAGPHTWPDVITGLMMDEFETLRTKITVPSSYPPDGIETAQLTFTATPVP